MAKRGTLSSNARRALVVNFVNQGLVHSQSDLVELLADEGIEVTQATASRDLDDVGAVRGKDASGIMRYQFIESSVEPLARMARVSDQLKHPRRNWLPAIGTTAVAGVTLVFAVTLWSPQQELLQTSGITSAALADNLDGEMSDIDFLEDLELLKELELLSQIEGV